MRLSLADSLISRGTHCGGLGSKTRTHTGDVMLDVFILQQV